MRAPSVLAAAGLLFFKFCRKCLNDREQGKQYQANLKAWDRYSKEHPEKFLDRQDLLTDFFYGYASKFESKLFFGGAPLTAASNACEVIALYNSLVALSINRPFPELLRVFSGKGICAHGLFGTDPAKIRDYALSLGLEVKEFKGRHIEELVRSDDDSPAYIFTSFNKGCSPFSMIHTLCVTRSKDGFIRHNDYAGSKTYPTLEEAIYGYNNSLSRCIYVLSLNSR